MAKAGYVSFLVLVENVLLGRTATKFLILLSVYLGDSATMSFLQLIRMNVETVAGSSPFTEDPKRFWITELQSNLPANHIHTHLLPSRDTANVLLQSFLANVCLLNQTLTTL